MTPPQTLRMAILWRRRHDRLNRNRNSNCSWLRHSSLAALASIDCCLLSVVVSFYHLAALDRRSYRLHPLRNVILLSRRRYNDTNSTFFHHCYIYHCCVKPYNSLRSCSCSFSRRHRRHCHCHCYKAIALHQKTTPSSSIQFTFPFIFATFTLSSSTHLAAHMVGLPYSCPKGTLIKKELLLRSNTTSTTNTSFQRNENNNNVI